MYIEQVGKDTNAFWLYVVGVLILGVVLFIGNVPFGVALVAEGGINAAQLSLSEQLQVLPANTTLFLLLLPFALVFGAILLLTRVLHKLSLRELITSRPKVDWKRIGFGFGTVAVSFILMLAVSYFMDPESLQWNFKPKAFAVLVLISVLMVPLQTSAEELFFRGYLMQGLGRIFPKRLLPFVISSSLFGLLHFANPEVDKLGDVILITYLATGFFLGAITLIDEGLELALGFHAGNNLFLSLFLTSDWTVFQTDSLFLDVSEPKVLMYIIGPLLIYSLLFMIYAKKYKWKNVAAHLIGSPTVEASS
ncbi:MAG: lysostaphin resistance A-like protein [Flavobacteriaceae bacterium]